MSNVRKDAWIMPVEERMIVYMDELYDMFYRHTLKRFKLMPEKEYKKELKAFFKKIGHTVEVEAADWTSRYRKPTDDDLNRDPEEFADIYVDVMHDEYNEYIVNVYMND